MTSHSFAMNRANCNLKFDITNSKTANACLRMCVCLCRFSLCVYSSLAIKGKDRSLTLMLCRRTRCGCYQVEVRFTVANLSALKVEIVSGSWGTTNQMLLPLLLVLQLLLPLLLHATRFISHIFIIFAFQFRFGRPFGGVAVVPLEFATKNFHCCHFAYKMHATSKMHLPAHNFRLWCSATSHQDAGIVVRQDASTAGCHAPVFTPFPRCPTPFEPFTLLFHLVIVIFLLLPPMLLLLLLHLYGALRLLFSFFFCNSVSSSLCFWFWTLQFLLFPRGKFMLHNAWTCQFTCVGLWGLLLPVPKRPHLTQIYNGPRPLLFVT